MGTDRRILLGPRVINSILKVFENPGFHEMYFDNVFTSVGLFKDLRAHGIKVTSIIWFSRLNNTT